MPSRPPVGSQLSVIMPLFNKGPHVERAIRSVLDQRGGFGEVIVVDDGSTDDGLRIVGSFQDDRIRVFNRSPPGPGGYAARNLGIERARGDWIAFLDADDTWSLDHTERLSDLLSLSADAECAFTGYWMQDADGVRRMPRWVADHQGTGPRRLNFEALLLAWAHYGDCPMWTGAIALRTDLLRRAGGFPAGRCRRGGDKDLWLRAASLSLCIVADATPSAVYHRDSVNMVTRHVKTIQPHCIRETVLELLLDRPAYRHTLEAVLAAENAAYAMGAALQGALTPHYVRENPASGWYPTLLNSIAPLPSLVQVTAARIARKAVAAGQSLRKPVQLGQPLA